MITTKQKWILGALFPLCAAIWFPQIAERFGGTGATAAAIGPEDEAILSTVASGGMVHMPGASGDPAAMPFDGMTPTGAAGGSTPGAGQRGIVSPEAALAAVLSTLQEADAFGGGRRARELARPQAASREDVEPSFTSPMVEFVGANPLCGTISGARTGVAVFGDHRVRVGESLPGTSAKVVEIGRGAVTISEGEISLEVELPPLRTSSGRSVQRGDAMLAPVAADGRFQEILDSANEPVSAGLVGATTTGASR